MKFYLLSLLPLINAIPTLLYEGCVTVPSQGRFTQTTSASTCATLCNINSQLIVSVIRNSTNVGCSCWSSLSTFASSDILNCDLKCQDQTNCGSSSGNFGSLYKIIDQVTVSTAVATTTSTSSAVPTASRTSTESPTSAPIVTQTTVALAPGYYAAIFAFIALVIGVALMVYRVYKMRKIVEAENDVNVFRQSKDSRQSSTLSYKEIKTPTRSESARSDYRMSRLGP